jgi:serine/threonine-protein kinase RsbW
VPFVGKPKCTIDVTQDLPTVRLELISRPEAPALVRAALAGVGEPLEVDPELLDDLRTAVSEACNNVVLHAYPAEPGPLVVSLVAGADAIQVVVRDRGTGFGRVPTSEDRMGVGLPVINALADRAEFVSAHEGGTEVRMEFAGRRVGKPLPDRATNPESASDLPPESASDLPALVSGDVVVTVSPVGLLTSVLGRLTRAVAGYARFSLDRFSDLYLVAEAISAHARGAAANARISFAIKAEDRRLELTAGPFQAGSGAPLQADTGSGRPRPLLARLADELTVERAGAVELLHVVVADRSRDPISHNS